VTGPRERITQRFPFRQDAGGQVGDCLRVAVASLLGMGIDDVPHFAAIEHGRPADDPLRHAWWWALVGWCRLLEPAFDVVSLDPLDRHAWPDPDDPDDPLLGCYLLTGPSPRGPWLHTVVAKAGRVVWDPHPDRTGLTGRPVAAERLLRRP